MKRLEYENARVYPICGGGVWRLMEQININKYLRYSKVCGKIVGIKQKGVGYARH